MGQANMKRILLKLSGEMLQGESQFGIDPVFLNQLAKGISTLIAAGIQVAVVIGGGNLFRGEALSQHGLDRVTGDQMGMMATIMNGLALSDALKQQGESVLVLSALPVAGVVDVFEHRRAMDALNKGQVTIFVGGTGNPFFTTDSAASLRAIEISADILLKATKVDGVYSDDPAKNPKATRYTHITYNDVLEKQLRVMDLTAICMCRDHRMPLRVFNLLEDQALDRIAQGEMLGTLVDNGESHD